MFALGDGGKNMLQGYIINDHIIIDIKLLANYLIIW